MASVVVVKRKTGPDGHKVLWREDNIQRSMTFDDERQADLLRRHLSANGNVLALAEVGAAHELAAGPTLEESIEYHVRSRTGVEDRTREDYRREARLHIIPGLGHLRTGQITRRQVRDWVNAAHESGASPKSISNWHALLSAVMTTAVDDGVRVDNPCKGVRMPERDRRHDHEVFLEPEEYLALLSQFGPMYSPVIETLAGTGTRWGEATALTTADLVVRGGDPYVRVNKAWKRDAKGRPFMSRPKTRRGVREVTISDELAELLQRLSAGRARDDYLLRSGSGHAVSYPYFHQKVWSPAVARAVAAGDLSRRPKIHDLRHSHASWLINDGVDLMTVQRRLGHESVTTTSNIYGHIGARAQRAAADSIGRVLRR